MPATTCHLYSLHQLWEEGTGTNYGWRWGWKWGWWWKRGDPGLTYLNIIFSHSWEEHGLVWEQGKEYKHFPG